jgi:hypothetical protein
MIPSAFRAPVMFALAALVSPVASVAQTPAPAAQAEPPAIRRWLDVQAVQAGLRYRWNETSAKVVTADGLQWHGLTRGRLLFDAAGKYSVNMMASAGATYVASWNDTSIGKGDFVGKFWMRHLFLSAVPVTGLELQVGGLAPNRGDVSENISYDMDGYLVGQRVTVRPTSGRITQLSGTIGHFGVAQPNVFRRLDDTFDYNYGQILMGVRVTPRVTASVDYTYEDGRDIIREAIVIRTPPGAKVVTGVRIEAYQRVSGVAPTGNGFNTSADLKFGKLTVNAGVMSVDRSYVPTVNGDRYGVGKRWYSLGTFPVNGDLSLIWYHTKGFDNAFPVSVNHRFDLIVVVNPTARLKRAGLF